jgi:hypothetical protein
MDECRSTLPRLWPYLALCGVLAAVVNGGEFHAMNTSDSLVPVLSSLYRWTPYFWECNRIGMLVPLLAVPFQNPLNNLLVQGWLVLFAAFATFFLLARYTLRTPSWPLVGALAAGLFAVRSELLFCFNATFGQPHYCVALALGTAGLLLTEPRPSGGVAWRLAAALGLLLLAVWVNSAVPVIFVPLVLLRSLLRPRPAVICRRAWLRGALDGEAAVSLGLLAAAAAGGQVGRLLVRAIDDPLARSILGVGRWPAAWGMLAANTWHVAVAPHWPAFLAVAAVAGLLLVVPAVRRQASGPLRAALTLAAGGLAYGLGMGTSSWVAANGFSFKYWIPVVFFLETVLAAVALAPLAALLRPRAHRVLGRLGGAALLAAVAFQHGLPSRGRVRAALDRLPQRIPLPQRTAEVLASRATHLLGTYGDVWICVFHANLVLYERGLDRRVWGVGGRCLPTWDLWGRMPPEDLRLAGLLDMPGGTPCSEVDGYSRIFFPPVVVVEKHSTLWLYRPADEVPSPDGPVLASWHSGFYGAEGPPGDSERWCGSPTGKLTLTNTSDRPFAVTLHLQAKTAQNAPSNLWIDSPLLCQHVLLRTGTPPLERTFVVPPGKHVLCFGTDAPLTPAPRDLRPQYFGLRNVTLTVQDYGPAAAP